MFSKKLTAVLIAVGVLTSTCALFNQIDIKGAFAESVKQNVVYTKDDTSTVSQDDGKVSGAEEEAYKEKSLELLKKCFNISVEENENFKFSACVLNEKTLDEIKAKELKAIQDSYDNKEISTEEYDKEMHDIEKNDSGLKEHVAELKHGMVQANWVDDNRCYLIDFNENTKEVDFTFVSEGTPKESDVPLTIGEDQLKNTAEKFIKQNKLGRIEKPKCILVEKYFIFYQDENDPSKKAEIGVDPFTGKVDIFSVNTYAYLEYNEAINRK